MASFEIEIKSLLGTEENAQSLREKMKALDPSVTMQSKNKQLNHYFEGGSLEQLIQTVNDKFSPEVQAKLSEFTHGVKEFSVRTRDKDGKVYLVIKASVDSTTSSNGISRKEFEEQVSLTLEELDQLVLSAGFSYQAKWSREREEYVVKGTNVTLDKNAGYGWLAEFERMVDVESAIPDAQNSIRELMDELNVFELQQDRLQRMFEHYNKHWAEYYGTDKVFVIE